jgi:hypothetical protein
MLAKVEKGMIYLRVKWLKEMSIVGISTDKIIAMMNDKMKELQVQKNNKQKVRDYVASIRTLCDVVLEAEDDGNEQPFIQQQSIKIFEEPQIQAMQQVQNQAVQTSTQKLKEEDANGDSLLDF